MRIFLDANVPFSASKSDGAVRELVKSRLKAKHECWVDSYVATEARRNLAAKTTDPAAALVELESLLSKMLHANFPSVDSGLELELLSPEKDRPVLAAAIRHRCAVLVTGDRTHFGALYGQTIEGVTVHSPRSLAELLFS